MPTNVECIFPTSVDTEVSTLLSTIDKYRVNYQSPDYLHIFMVCLKKTLIGAY